MTRFSLRHAMLSLASAPLVLGLAACGDTKTEGEVSSSEPIANIAPPEGASWAETIEKTPEGGYRMGNPDAPIKLIEYGALSCSHCAEFAEASFGELRDDYVASGRVSYELRYFMLNVLDVPSTLLATCGSTEAVIPLSEQFWGWQRTMFDNMQSAGQERLAQVEALPKDQQIAAIADIAGMTEFFSSRGIARDQAQSCLADTDAAKALADQTQAATEKFDINGTPSFIINGNVLGSMTWNDLEAKLQQAGAR